MSRRHAAGRAGAAWNASADAGRRRSLRGGNISALAGFQTSRAKGRQVEWAAVAVEDHPAGPRGCDVAMLTPTRHEQGVDRHTPAVGDVAVLQRAPDGVLLRVEPAPPPAGGSAGL